MSDNVTKKAAAAFANLVSEGSASNESLIEMGLAIGYSVEELNDLYENLYEDSDEDNEDEDEVVENA
jgi:hypothetical protein